MEKIELLTDIQVRIAAHCAKYGLDPAEYKSNPEWDINSIVAYAPIGYNLDNLTKDIPTCVFDGLNLDSTSWIPMCSFTRNNIDYEERPTTTFILCCVNIYVDSDLYGYIMIVKSVHAHNNSEMRVGIITTSWTNYRRVPQLFRAHYKIPIPTAS